MTDEMPQAIDAERQLLGAALTDPATLDTTRVQPQAFYRPAHEQLWRLLLTMHNAGEPTEPGAVLAKLTTSPIRGIDGAYLHGLYGGLITSANADYYAGLVTEAHDLRAVREAGVRLVQMSGDSTAADAKAEARKILDALDVRDTGTVRIGDVVDDVLEEAETGPTGTVLPTPWPELDEVTTGLRSGALYTVGARPGVGKSVIGAGLAWQVALHGPIGLVFSLEMSRRDVTRRMVAAAASVDYGRLLRGRVSEVEWQRIARARNVLAETPFVIDDRSGINVHEIAATARHHARTGNLGVVVVDYMQLVTPTDRKVSREQQVSEASRALKVLAGDLQVPVVMLSQLNREVEKRQDKHPTLADLRESGSLEQDSDVVLLLFRDEEKAPDWLDVGVAKNRFGSPTAVRLGWEGHFQRVVSPSLQQGRWAS